MGSLRLERPGSPISLGGGADDHGSLSDLLADDHTQYALLAGRSVLQTLAGGTTAGSLALKPFNSSTNYLILNDGEANLVSMNLNFNTSGFYIQNAGLNRIQFNTSAPHIDASVRVDSVFKTGHLRFSTAPHNDIEDSGGTTRINIDSASPHVAITGDASVSGALVLTGLLTANGGIQMGAGDVIEDSGGTDRILLATVSPHITLTGDIAAATFAGLITANGGIRLGAGDVIEDSGGTARIALATTAPEITLTAPVIRLGTSAAIIEDSAGVDLIRFNQAFLPPVDFRTNVSINGNIYKDNALRVELDIGGSTTRIQGLITSTLGWSGAFLLDATGGQVYEDLLVSGKASDYSTDSGYGVLVTRRGDTSGGDGRWIMAFGSGAASTVGDVNIWRLAAGTLTILNSGVGGTNALARLKIGDQRSAPATSAVLDLDTTTGALLLPRMTTTQRDALTAVNGMGIYNTTTAQMEKYEAGAWVAW